MQTNKFSIFMDIDGVLFNTQGPIIKATKKAFAEVLNYKLSEYECSFMWGITWEEIQEYMHKEKHFARQDMQKARALRNSLIKWPAPNPVAKSFLKANINKTVLCTAGSLDTTYEKIRRLDMPELGISRVLCSVKKDFDFWFAGVGQQAELVIDDSIQVIIDAERAGKKTIHWRQFK